MDLCWSSEIRKTQLAGSACYTDCLRAASVKRSWCLITWTHVCTILDIPPDEGSNSKTLVLCEEWGAQPICLITFQDFVCSVLTKSMRDSKLNISSGANFFLLCLLEWQQFFLLLCLIIAVRKKRKKRKKSAVFFPVIFIISSAWFLVVVDLFFIDIPSVAGVMQSDYINAKMCSSTFDH